MTQRKVTFSQTGIGGDSSGTVFQVNGTGTNPANASLVAASLGTATFYDDGSSWAYQSPVAASAGKRYVVGTTSGTLGAADEGTTKTGGVQHPMAADARDEPGRDRHLEHHAEPDEPGWLLQRRMVSLTAATSVSSGGSPYTFQNWTGNVASPPDSTNPISVTMNQPRSVTANYAPDGFGVSVSKSGNGSGTVTSSPAGINCECCSSSYTNGTVVTLTATPATGSNFTGWSGAGCSGTGTCVVTVDAAKSVTAQFALQTFVNVSKTGAGTGSVSSSPVGITCGATCSNTFDYGTSVTLTATPATGSTFTGWSGGLGFLEAGEHPLPVRLLGLLVVDRRADGRHVRRRHSCGDPSHVSTSPCGCLRFGFGLAGRRAPRLAAIAFDRAAAIEHHLGVVLLRGAGHHGGEMAERMAVGRAELGGEIDVAAELQHPVVVALEDGVGLLRRQLELLEDTASFALKALRFSSFISDMQNMLMP